MTDTPTVLTFFGLRITLPASPAPVSPPVAVEHVDQSAAFGSAPRAGGRQT